MTGPFSGQALLVEDNLIIALDVSDMLETVGAKTVHVAAACAEALDILSNSPIDYAVVDVMLDGVTCEPVARRLKELDIPFVYASGVHDIQDSLPQAPKVTKPYSPDALLSALEDSIRQKQGFKSV
jgi:CheY-like chemotaxis protein